MKIKFIKGMCLECALCLREQAGKPREKSLHRHQGTSNNSREAEGAVPDQILSGCQ